MLKKILMTTVVIVLLIVLVGCISKEPTVVGEWYSELEKITMTLNEDGSFYVTDENLEDSDLLSGTYRIKGNQFFYTPVEESELANTYTVTEDTLVLTYEGYTSTLKRVVK